MSFLALTLVSCGALRPTALPEEVALDPSQSPLWKTLEAIRSDDWFVLLNDGGDALDWRLLAIDSARKSIDLQTFLWSVDAAGSRILDRLIAAADRGVRVRLLIDDTFLLARDDRILAIARHPEIEYRVFNPFKRRASGFATRQALNLGEFRRLDHRMHNKAMVVDGRVAIIGGRNLADEYFGLHAETNFRDLELLFGGPCVPQVADSFDAYWNDEWSVPIASLSDVPMDTDDIDRARLVGRIEESSQDDSSPDSLRSRWARLVRGAIPGDPELIADDPPEGNPALAPNAPTQLAARITRLLDSAKEDVLLVSPYLIPHPDLEALLARLVERGVRVRILTNGIRSNNHLVAHSAYRRHIEALLEGGAQLHEVRSDARSRALYMTPPADSKSLALHAKAIVIDHDRVFIGSPNLDPRSLRINTEVGVIVVSSVLNDNLRRALEPDFERSNAWELRRREDGHIVWVSDDRVLTRQPAASFMQRIEDWFFSHLPIEDEL